MMQKLKRPLCPHCGETAQFYRVTREHPQKIYCPACSKTYNHIAAPKVLVLDIETSGILFRGFDIGKTVIRHNQVVEDWYVICWSGKWLFQKETFGAVATPKEAKARDDKRVIRLLHNQMKAADFIITHNGNRFDLKKINWRFMYHQFKPLQKYGSIDTLAKIKQVSKPTSMALDFLCKRLGYDGKMETEKGLWDRCEAGEADALKAMYIYNQVDIWKTEDLYAHAFPYFKTHPNFASFLNMYQDVETNEHRCPRCIKGVISKEKFTQFYETPGGYFYKVASCPNCGCMVRKSKRVRKQHVKVV